MDCYGQLPIHISSQAISHPWSMCWDHVWRGASGNNNQSWNSHFSSWTEELTYNQLFVHFLFLFLTRTWFSPLHTHRQPGLRCRSVYLWNLTPGPLLNYLLKLYVRWSSYFGCSTNVHICIFIIFDWCNPQCQLYKGKSHNVLWWYFISLVLSTLIVGFL